MQYGMPQASLENRWLQLSHGERSDVELSPNAGDTEKNTGHPGDGQDAS